ncbi:hypothetical protein [Armatimonas sp.]|uniref:hypothetical protein n=1 Tax=Armatimonas sp. TaxID=1872638 RepID=UPI003751FE17
MSSKVPEMVVTGRLSQTPTRARTLDRHAEWWEMRRQGYTTYTIAAKFGVSQQAVSKAMLAMEENLYKVLAAQAAPMKASQTAQLEANLERSLLEWEKSKDVGRTEREVEKTLGKPKESQEGQAHGGSLKRSQREELKGEWDDVDLEAIPGLYYDPETDEETLPEERPKIIAAYLLSEIKRKALESTEALLERTLTTTRQWQCGDPRYLAEIRASLADIRKIWGLDAPVKQEIAGAGGGPVNIAFTDSLNRVYGTSESEPITP